MTSTFSKYAARLGDFIQRSLAETVTSRPDDAEFNDLALDLFALQFSHNQPYRRFCEGRSVTLDSVNHWSAIPAIAAAAFKELELTSLPAARRPIVFHSSGTTEHRPARHFHDAESLALYEASLLPWFSRHVIPSPRPPSTFISLTPSPGLAPHSSLVHMFATVHRELGSADATFTGRIQADGWDVDCELTVARLDRVIKEARPVIVMGTAFNFLQLLDHLENERTRLPLPAGSRAMETGGYKGRTRTLPKSELHSLITVTLGIPRPGIISEYGMCELSSQAYEVFPATAFQFPPWARAQVVSPETGREVDDGDSGLIRIFDLANLRSVLAVQTEDLAIRRGDGFELLGRVAPAEARGCSLMTIQ